MDNLEYLNKISKPTTGAAKTTGKAKLFGNNSAIWKIAIGGAVIFFLLMMLGNLMGSLNSKTSDLTKQLYTRSNNLNTVITANNKVLKSSRLRAIGLSLSAVLTNSTRELQAYLTPEGSDKKKALVPDAKLAKTEQETLDNLQNILTNARLNGILDRTYSNQIGLQVALLLSMISELNARTKDAKLKEILATFHSNLQPIYQSLEEYSNTGS